MKKKTRIFLILGIGIFVFVLIAGGVANYSTKPSFCKSCHIMEPYYNAWITSKHNEVKCVECHYPPGEPRTILWKKFQALSQVVKYVTRTYSSKPYAEIEDASCLRQSCHSERLLEGKMIYKDKILFDHRPHLYERRRGRRLRCTSCHSQIVVGKHIEVTWDSCYLCHFKGYIEKREVHPAGGCLSCHILPEQDIRSGNITYNHKDFIARHKVECTNCHLDIIQGQGAVDSDRCLACHNQIEKLDRFNDIPFIHENHITTRNVACFHCHSEMKHEVVTQGPTLLAGDCGLCHVKKHSAQTNLYLGIGTISLDIDPMPSPMYLANVDCVSCHKLKTDDGGIGGFNFKGDDKSCENCHPEKYNDMVDDSKGIIEESENLIKEKIDKIFSKLKGDDKSELEGIVYDTRLIDKGHGIHNIYYTAQILRYSNQVLDQIAERNEIEVENINDNELISGYFCATMCHQKIGIDVPPEEVQHNNKIMPHVDHWKESEIGCFNCHIFSEHKNVQSIINEEFCLECHDEVP